MSACTAFTKLYMHKFVERTKHVCWIVLRKACVFIETIYTAMRVLKHSDVANFSTWLTMVQPLTLVDLEMWWTLETQIDVVTSTCQVKIQFRQIRVLVCLEITYWNFTISWDCDRVIRIISWSTRLMITITTRARNVGQSRNCWHRFC